MAKDSPNGRMLRQGQRSYPLTPLAQRRALGYPYECSYRPLVVTGGGFLLPQIAPWPQDDSWHRALAGRHASLAIGSNRSVRQLARKYRGWPEPLALPLWPVRVVGLDVHFAAAIGHYGAIPATPIRAPGTICDLMLVWLTPAERVRMDETEALGHAYNRYSVPVESEGLPVPVHTVDIYVHHAGTYALTGRQSVAMAELPVANAANAHIGRLDQRAMQLRLRHRYAPRLSLEQFVAGNIHEPRLRRARAARMARSAVPAWSPAITDGALRYDQQPVTGGGALGTVSRQYPPIHLVSLARAAVGVVSSSHVVTGCHAQ